MNPFSVNESQQSRDKVGRKGKHERQHCASGVDQSGEEGAENPAEGSHGLIEAHDGIAGGGIGMRRCQDLQQRQTQDHHAAVNDVNSDEQDLRMIDQDQTGQESAGDQDIHEGLIDISLPLQIARDRAVQKQRQESDQSLEDAVIGGRETVLIFQIIVETLLVGILAKRRNSGDREDQRQQRRHELPGIHDCRKGIDVFQTQRMFRDLFIRGIIQACEEPQKSGGSDNSDLHQESGFDRDQSQHAPDEIADRTADVLDGDQRDQKTALTFLILFAEVDHIIRMGNIDAPGKSSCQHSSQDHSGLVLSKSENDLAGAVAETADQKDPLDRKIIAEPPPQRREKEIHRHHCRESDAEKRGIQSSFDDQCRGDRMSEVCCHIEQEVDQKEDQKTPGFFMHEFMITQKQKGRAANAQDPS